MTQSLSPDTFSSPFDAWTRLATQTREMLLASVEVIGHRSYQIVRSGGLFSNADQVELTLMGQEKLEALSESAQETSARLFALGQEFGALAFTHMTSGASRMAALAICLDPERSNQLQADIVQSALNNSTVVTSSLTDSMAQVVHTAIQPMHLRAVANARRLGADS